MSLEILYQDNKTKMDFGEKESFVDFLLDGMNIKVFPVHRLDKPTSGVLIFALSSEMARVLSEQFLHRKVKKKYLAVVRGTPKPQDTIDHPLREELDKISDKMARKDKPAQEAVTHIKTLAQIELPVQVDKYPTSRYALVEANPVTGRKHQIRRHLRHINHSINGDGTHGNSKHNRVFENEFKIRRLLLTCKQMTFQHPKTDVELTINAQLSSEFNEIIERLGWKEYI